MMGRFCTMVHLCLACYLQPSFLYGGWSALDGDTASAAVLELDHSFHRLQRRTVPFTSEDGEHARVVVSGGDRGA
jgi:hypothetical protein